MVFYEELTEQVGKTYNHDHDKLSSSTCI